MSINPNIAEVVSLLAEPSRATILTHLMDGRFHTASELALMTGITPQTASFHLSKLIEGRLITFEKHGRHRYYQLASTDIASLLESFLAISAPPKVRSLRQSTQVQLLREARTCYDHLAGKLGVDLTDALLANQYITTGDTEFVITPKGETFFTHFGLDLPTLKRKRRSFSHACLDWSERRHHLGGALGQGLMNHLFDIGWIVRVPSIRAIKVTKRGTTGLHTVFDLKR